MAGSASPVTVSVESIARSLAAQTSSVEAGDGEVGVEGCVGAGEGAGPSTLTVGVPEPHRTMTARDVPSPGLDSRCTAPAGTRKEAPGPASTTTPPPGPDSSRI